MKAVLLDKPGKPGSQRIGEIAKPQVGEGEVLVRVHATSLNPVDYKLAAGGHPAWQYPFVLGLDVAGSVAALGPGVTGWQVGDRVVYHGNLSRPGGYAEYTVAAAHVLARIPEEVSYVAAAAVPCAGMTAYQALHKRMYLQPGQTILVQAGSGGVGGFAIQLAALAGATVLTTTSAHNFDYVRGLGADQAIDYNTEDVHERVMALTDGRGVDKVMDNVSGPNATAGTKMLAFGGGLASVAGQPDYAQVPFNKAISLHTIMLGGAYFNGGLDAQAQLATMAEALLALIASGKIDPMVREVVPLEGVPQALEKLSGRHVRGKIVAQVLP